VLEINIPGHKKMLFEHLVLDFNGTVAIDGTLIDGVIKRLADLSTQLTIHVLTADTNKSVKAQFTGLNFKVHIIGPNNQELEKYNYIKGLGCERCICFGNGANDRLMLERAGLGICVLQKEGVYSKTLMSSNIVVKDIRDGLDMFIKQNRLIATLRI